MFTVEESRALRGNLPGGHCKNLFLKDRKGHLWLLVVLEELSVNLKVVRSLIDSKQLSFAKTELANKEIISVKIDIFFIIYPCLIVLLFK